MRVIDGGKVAEPEEDVVVVDVIPTRWHFAQAAKIMMGTWDPEIDNDEQGKDLGHGFIALAESIAEGIHTCYGEYLGKPGCEHLAEMMPTVIEVNGESDESGESDDVEET